MTLLLSCDPGKMTGVALFALRGEDPEFLEAHEFLRDELEHWLEDVLLFGEPQAREDIEVVAERYVLSDLDSPWSLRELGVLSYLARKGGWGEPVLQTPADAKSFATDDRLRSLGWFQSGLAGHANDAIRHAIVYMVRKQMMSARSLLTD